MTIAQNATWSQFQKKRWYDDDRMREIVDVRDRNQNNKVYRRWTFMAFYIWYFLRALHSSSLFHFGRIEFFFAKEKSACTFLPCSFFSHLLMLNSAVSKTYSRIISERGRERLVIFNRTRYSNTQNKYKRKQQNIH